MCECVWYITCAYSNLSLLCKLLLSTCACTCACACTCVLTLDLQNFVHMCTMYCVVIFSLSQTAHIIPYEDKVALEANEALREWRNKLIQYYVVSCSAKLITTS